MLPVLNAISSRSVSCLSRSETNTQQRHNQAKHPTRLVAYRIHPCIRRTFLSQNWAPIVWARLMDKITVFLMWPDTRISRQKSGCVLCLGATYTWLNTVLHQNVSNGWPCENITFRVTFNLKSGKVISLNDFAVANTTTVVTIWNKSADQHTVLQSKTQTCW